MAEQDNPKHDQVVYVTYFLNLLMVLPREIRAG